MLPGASRSSHRVESERSEAAKGASGGGLCSYCLSSALNRQKHGLLMIASEQFFNCPVCICRRGFIGMNAQGCCGMGDKLHPVQ